MPPRRKRQKMLGVDDKDYDETEIGPEDANRYWVSKNPYSARNRNPRVAANQADYGFNHLSLPAATAIVSDTEQPPAVSFVDRESEYKYLALIQEKFSLCHQFLLQERNLSLDPDRPTMLKETVPMLLAQPPIKIDIFAQHRMRLVMDEEARLRRFAVEKEQEDAEVREAENDYWMFWTHLQEAVAGQVRGNDQEERMDRADTLLCRILDKLVEPLN